MLNPQEATGSMGCAEYIVRITHGNQLFGLPGEFPWIDSRQINFLLIDRVTLVELHAACAQPSWTVNA